MKPEIITNPESKPLTMYDLYEKSLKIKKRLEGFSSIIKQADADKIEMAKEKFGKSWDEIMKQELDKELLKEVLEANFVLYLEKANIEKANKILENILRMNDRTCYELSNNHTVKVVSGHFFDLSSDIKCNLYFTEEKLHPWLGEIEKAKERYEESQKRAEENEKNWAECRKKIEEDNKELQEREVSRQKAKESAFIELNANSPDRSHSWKGKLVNIPGIDELGYGATPVVTLPQKPEKVLVYIKDLFSDVCKKNVPDLDVKYLKQEFSNNIKSLENFTYKNANNQLLTAKITVQDGRPFIEIPKEDVERVQFKLTKDCKDTYNRLKPSLRDL